MGVGWIKIPFINQSFHKALLTSLSSLWPKMFYPFCDRWAPSSLSRASFSKQDPWYKYLTPGCTISPITIVYSPNTTVPFNFLPLEQEYWWKNLPVFLSPISLLPGLCNSWCCSCLHHWPWHETAVGCMRQQPWWKALARSSPPEKSAAGQHLGASTLLTRVPSAFTLALLSYHGCYTGSRWGCPSSSIIPDVVGLSSLVCRVAVFIPLGELQQKITAHFLSQTRHAWYFVS